MERFNLNIARSFIGHNVNIHLKDGSVIVNVHVRETGKNRDKKEPFINCITQKRRRPLKISLKEVAWAEPLNPYILF